MSTHPSRISRVLDVLRKNPRGMNIREIAETTKINRMSVAKYLEILTALETTDVRTMGNAKLYYLSQRIPVTAFLKITSKQFFVLNKDAVIVQINDSFPRHTGLEPGEMIGMSIREKIRIRIRDSASWDRAFEAALEGEENSIEVEDHFNGIVTWYNVTMMPVIFPDSSRGVIVIGDDITDKKLIEAALISNEQKYRGLVENINDLVFSIDLSGILTYISPRVKKYGYAPEDLVGKHFDRIIYPADLDLIVTHFFNIRNAGVYLKGILFRALAADGQIVWFEGNGMIQQDESGRYTCINGVLRDITERVDAEHALDESRRQYEALINNFDGFALIRLSDRRIEYMSERFARLHGFDATGMICHKAFFNLDTVCPWCMANRVANGERVIRNLEDKTGGTRFQVVSMPSPRPDGSLSLALIVSVLGDEWADLGISPDIPASCRP